MNLINAFFAFLSIQIREDIVIVGYNGENADYDNPRGAIYGRRYYLVATAVHQDNRSHDDGLQWANIEGFNNVADAEAYEGRVLEFMNYGGQLNDEFWGEIEPRYGTQAWLNWNAEHPETWND
jgi:hypothetical protein